MKLNEMRLLENLLMLDMKEMILHPRSACLDPPLESRHREDGPRYSISPIVINDFFDNFPLSMRPSIRQLEYLIAVADALHFGRAAQSCAVTQPALSAQIQQRDHVGR